VVRKAGQEVGLLPEFEVGKIEAEGDRASEQSPVLRPGSFRAEPAPARNHRLEHLPRFEIPAQPDDPVGQVVEKAMDGQRGPVIEMPDLVGAEAVEVGPLARSEAKINRGGRGSRSGVKAGKDARRDHFEGPVDFPKMAAFRGPAKRRLRPG
jgi:hypothetical protein